MNLPISWLKDYVDIDCDTKTFADKMTLSGSKVESVTNAGDFISNVVVGKVLSIDKHPDADKLVICQIDVGQSDPIQIVTGASNLYVGAFVPVALDGAKLCGGIKIKKGKLRGVASNGMMCSVEELGFTRNDYPEAPEHGIYIFDKEYSLGSDVKPILEIDDDVVEFEITSNRPDCFSIVGLAREAAATFKKPFKYPEITVKEEGGLNTSDMISVEIKNSELCPRYIARAVKNVKIGPSPQWLRHRLTASGIRPINNIVDITNYVMLELGQPMHAFDIDTIDDRKIIVRNAEDGEKIVTLDGIERELDSSMLVISDCNKAVAVAGVMGGENSKITENASAILFESANFNGPNVRITAKKLGLRTDASGKYEKGLDPNLSLDAVNRAVQLVEILGCGEVIEGIVDCYPNKKEKSKLKYSPDNINKLLGINISSEEMIEIFKLIEVDANGNEAIIPTFRPDLESEADLAEEIARFYGYDNIKTTLAAGTPTVGKKNKKQIIEDIIRNIMTANGLSEAMTFSFESARVFDKLGLNKDDKKRITVTISNPLGEDFSVMRTTSINGMLNSLSINYNRRNSSAYLFELAKVYIPESIPLEKLPYEKNVLSIGMYGNTDFFELKGIIEELFDALSLSDKTEYISETTTSYMHPGRCAKIIVEDKTIGIIGQIHPNTAKAYNIGTDVYICELDIDALIEYTTFSKTYNPLPKYPSVQRDIALIVKDDIPVSSIEKIIKNKGGKLLENIALFDVYKGGQIEKGYKSVAYNITFRSLENTLKDEEVNPIVNKILKAIENELGAQLREK